MKPWQERSHLSLGEHFESIMWVKSDTGFQKLLMKSPITVNMDLNQEVYWPGKMERQSHWSINGWA